MPNSKKRQIMKKMNRRNTKIRRKLKRKNKRKKSKKKKFRGGSREQYTKKIHEIELSDKYSLEDIKNLKEGQKIMSNLLREFDRICRKHNIRYYCIGGTALGVIRHKGWIPWDGDIDICINQKDYDILKSIVQDELPNNMWFQNHEIDKNYPKNNSVQGKIRDLNSCYIEYTNNSDKSWHNGLQLDIFIDEKYKYKMPDEDIFPLREKPFEDFNVFIMKNTEKYLDYVYGKEWIHLFPKEKRIAHEGKIDAFNTCPFHYEKYPELYNKHKI